jgi:hypothetical protein
MAVISRGQADCSSATTTGWPTVASLPCSGVSPLVQLTAGAIRYSVDNALLRDRATNFPYSGGLGVEAQLNRRLSILALAKDYLASFRSVDQAAVLGIEGRRSHTLAWEIGAGLGF